MSTSITLSINEMFETIQGEGAHTGIPSIFVRLQGCPVGCPWCDTKHTWTLDDALVTTAQAVIAKNEESEHYFDVNENELLTQGINYNVEYASVALWRIWGILYS